MNLQAARRYALALFKAAQESNAVTETSEDLDAISRILEASPETKTFLESPKVDRSRKLAFVDKVFSDRARPLTMRLLRLLIEKNRQKELRGIHREYKIAVEDASGIMRAFITSAVPLSENEVERISKLISDQTGKKIIAEAEVDPKVIAGVSVQYGNSVLDGTVFGALKRLEEKFQFDVLKQA
ncbi:MAG: ATP synthase F1 subunit delta [Armatimonadota bacterium]|nr:ATP synthase F1 subunit delta [Armatimonadota bacterium]